MNPVLVALSLLFSGVAATSSVATLRVAGDKSTFTVKVTEDASVGFRITIDCTERCATAVHYSEATGDTPLGLFSRDQNDLIFSTWSGGSAYRVLVWSVANGTVRKVAELSSRGRPDFVTGSDGAPVIQTYEADGRATTLRRVRWTFAHDHFVRSRSNGS